MWLQKITFLKRKAAALGGLHRWTAAFAIRTLYVGIFPLGVNGTCTCICFYVCLLVLTRRTEGFKLNPRNYKYSSLTTEKHQIYFS